MVHRLEVCGRQREHQLSDIHVKYSCYFAYWNDDDALMRKTPGADGMELWRHTSDLLVRKRWKKAARRFTAWFLSTSPGRILSHSYLKLQHVLVFSFVCCRATDKAIMGCCAGLLHAKLVCSIVRFIRCHCRSTFLFPVFAVCTKLLVWNKCSVGCSLLHKGYDRPYYCHHGDKKSNSSFCL